MPAVKEQLLSRTVYDTDGTTTVWNFAFSGGYLDKAHVKAYTLNALGGRTDLVFDPNTALIGPYQLQITPALAAGLELTIYRDTPKNAPLVNFSDGTAFTEAAVDTVAQQSVFVAAEAIDQVNSLNVADAIQSGEDAGNAATAAQASASAASASATNAAASATTAATKATEATTARNDAVTIYGSIAAVQAAATSATTAATNAASSQTAAASSATSASGSATTATTKASEAAASASSAATSAATATSQASSATASAATATTKASEASASATNAAASAAVLNGVNKIAQIVRYESQSLGSSAATITWDDSIPQISEGDQFVTQTFTPVNASSTIYVRLEIPVFNRNAVEQGIIAALFLNDDTNAKATAVESRGLAAWDGRITISKSLPSWSGAKTFSVRLGASASSLFYTNGRPATLGTLGARFTTSLEIIEVLP